MKRITYVDFIIVGRGIAGSILAHELMNAGQKIVVYDTPSENKSSTVAAGLFNPVTGRRFVKTWMADPLFSYLSEFYENLEKKLNTKWYFPIPLFRPFLSVKEKNDVIARNQAEDLGFYIHQIIEKPFENRVFRNVYGGILLKKTGYINIPELISGIRKKIIQKGEFKEELLEYSQLEILQPGVRYKEYIAHKIIFCEGVGGVKNPYFSWLPFRPVKGEIILIRPEADLDIIFNRQIFILPLIDKTLKVGATYDWDNIDSQPTEKGKKFLEEKLNHYLKVNYNVIDQFAGVRPATKDRRPFIGQHPEHPELGIFNGLGSKGVSLAPYFARKFVDKLLFGKELDKEVNIKRYY